jgi:NADH:ubiquinone oxidoreductase subunit 5 (subunit L)/multisubunit Na+/H+ antiporter MnhA subunit
MYFLVFHGEERFGKAMMRIIMSIMATTTTRRSHDHHHGLAPGQKPHETPWVVTLPLVLLAIPSVVIGFIAIGPMVFGDLLQDGDPRHRQHSGHLHRRQRPSRPWPTLPSTSTALPPWACTR